MKSLARILSPRSPLGLGTVGLILAGCTQIFALDPTTLESANDAAVDARENPVFECTSSQFDPALGSASVDTETEVDHVTLSCGAEGGGDQLLSWQAPGTDYYVFDTNGSSFDTVLGLLDGCDGNELACDHKTVGMASEIVRKFAHATDVVIVVDGFAGDQGIGTLNVARVSCPDSGLEGQSFPLPFSTAGFGDDYSNDCGGLTREDRAYRWVAPTDGLYAFKIRATGYAAIVSVMDGPRCSDTLLGCSKAAEGGMRAEVVRRLVAGQVVSIYVDGVDGDGPFEIDVSDPLEAPCPDEDGPADGSSVVDRYYTPRVLSPSCGFPEVFDGLSGPVPLGDISFKLDTAGPVDSCVSRTCTIDIESTGLFHAYLLDQNDCGGRELACETATPGSPYTASLQFEVSNNDIAHHTLVVADGEEPSDEAVAVSLSCFDTCP